MSLSVELKSYKLRNGAVDYGAVLKIPFKDRLIGLIENVGYKEMHITLGVAVQLSMEAMNLSKPLAPAQIISLVDNIIDTCEEDYLSLEDVLLFLQKLVRGEAGDLFSSLDIPKFMRMFEKYRQERHSAFLRFKEEIEAQRKCTPLSSKKGIIKKDPDMDASTFFDLLQTFNEQGKGE